MLELRVNGEAVQLEEGCTLAGLLEKYNIQPGRVVVELNRRIIQREQYGETVLQSGDQVELVTFVGGG